MTTICINMLLMSRIRTKSNIDIVPYYSPKSRDPHTQSVQNYATERTTYWRVESPTVVIFW